MKLKKHNPTWEHIKLVAWVILIIEILILCIALAAGRNAGYLYAFKICFWLGLIVAVVFLSIFLLDLLRVVAFSFIIRIRNFLFRKMRIENHIPDIFDTTDLRQILKNADHVDVKTVEGNVGLAVFIADMLSYRPAWLLMLYRIRKIFVRLLGMPQEETSEMLQPLSPEDVSFQPGDTASFFIVRYAAPGRFWIAETPDDKHLQAYFGIFKKKIARHKNKFYVMTVVHYKHWTGPVYFNVIRPLHHLVVRQMALAGLKGAISL